MTDTERIPTPYTPPPAVAVVDASADRFQATDPDGSVLTITPWHELHEVEVARYGTQVIRLDDAALDALAEHLLHRGDLAAALDRHVQALRTVAIRLGGSEHLVAAGWHLVEARRAAIDATRTPCPSTSQRVA